MPDKQQILRPFGAGLLGSIFLVAIYFGIVSIAESSEHALDLLLQDRAYIIPLILGFGVQVGLYTLLKMRSSISAASSRALTGAGGSTSAVAMVACCAHHVTEVLPILGLTAATAFLAEYQRAFMLLGLGTTLSGILVMLVILYRQSQKALRTPFSVGRMHEIR